MTNSEVAHNTGGECKMLGDEYDKYFEMHHEQAKKDLGQLVNFAVRFFQLVCYPGEILEGWAKCPGD